MPTASLVELIEEMADQIRVAMDAATAGTDISVQVEPLRVFTPSPPTIDIFPADEFRALDGAGFGDVYGHHRFTVRARIDTGDADASQEILVDMMDDESDYCVARALLDEPTLNGLAADLTVESFPGFRQYVDPGEGGAYLGVEWSVLVARAYS